MSADEGRPLIPVPRPPTARESIDAAAQRFRTGDSHGAALLGTGRTASAPARAMWLPVLALAFAIAAIALVLLGQRGPARWTSVAVAACVLVLLFATLVPIRGSIQPLPAVLLGALAALSGVQLYLEFADAASSRAARLGLGIGVATLALGLVVASRGPSPRRVSPWPQKAPGNSTERVSRPPAAQPIAIPPPPQGPLFRAGTTQGRPRQRGNVFSETDASREARRRWAQEELDAERGGASGDSFTSAGEFAMEQ